MITADSRILRKFRALQALACNPGALPGEAENARARVEQFAVKYGLGTAAAMWQSSVAMPTAPPVAAVVHLAGGFAPSGESKWRAYCRCGYGTTPRVTRERARRALITTHELDAPECVLCGVSYAHPGSAEFWDRFLEVLTDPSTADEFIVCRDILGCRRRDRDRHWDRGDYAETRVVPAGTNVDPKLSEAVQVLVPRHFAADVVAAVLAGVGSDSFAELIQVCSEIDGGDAASISLVFAEVAGAVSNPSKSAALLNGPGKPAAVLAAAVREHYSAMRVR